MFCWGLPNHTLIHFCVLCICLVNKFVKSQTEAVITNVQATFFIAVLPTRLSMSVLESMYVLMLAFWWRRVYSSSVAWSERCCSHSAVYRLLKLIWKAWGCSTDSDDVSTQAKLNLIIYFFYTLLHDHLAHVRHMNNTPICAMDSNQQIRYITLCVSETSYGLAVGVGPVRSICQIG